MRAIITFLALAFSLSLSAQDSLMAFVLNPLAARLQPQPVEGYKYEVAQRVFQTLLKANGSFRLPPPELVMNDGRRYMAWMQADKRQIGLEEKAYDICSGLGKDSLNALAALLSHEIIHYYEKHSWKRHFISMDEDSGINMEEGKAYEQQADYLGGILALSAGFNTYHTLDTLLKEAYSGYGLPEKIRGYPSLSERLKLSAQTAKRLQNMYQLYQTANLLALIEQHGRAAEYYDYILKEYQGYELYNNGGANALLAALELTPPDEMPFVLPVELDLNSRLAQLGARLPEDVAARRHRFLEQAEQWLKNALLLNEDRSTAHLNLSITYLLREEWLDAEYRARKAMAIADATSGSGTIANADILLGVIAALRGDTAAAALQFQKAEQARPTLAAGNLAMLRGGTALLPEPAEPERGVEMIAGIEPDTYLAYPEYESELIVSRGVYNGFQPKDSAQILMHYEEDGPHYAMFLQTNDNYHGATNRGVSLGASISQIHQAYGPPNRILTLADGQCLAYDEQKILFLLDETAALRRWVVFRKSFDPEE